MRLYTKDSFTAGNLLAGFASALLAMRGELMWAGLMMPVAMFFDAFDGLVARLTHRHNRFGGEFDNVADHMSYGVAPGFLLFAAYEPVFRHELGLHAWVATVLAFAVGAVPIFFGSVRFARFNTYHYKTPGYWLGVPRPATAFALAALVNSHLFAAGIHARLACIVLVLLLGALNASTFPYLNHHHAGKTPWTVWFYYGVFTSSTLLAIGLGPLLGLVPNEFVGDTILFSMGCYSFFGWMEVPTSARKSARTAVLQSELEDLKSAGEDVSTLVAKEQESDEAGPSTGGLPGSVAGGLAYVLGPITGLLFMRGPYARDPFVRFHAWQSVFTVISMAVIFCGLWILHGMAAALWPGFSLLMVVGIPVGVFYAGTWLAMMVQAFRGKKLHGPVIGQQAEKQLA